MGRMSDYDKLVRSISKALSKHPDVIQFHQDLATETNETSTNLPEVYGVDFEIDLGDDNDPFSLINLKK